MKSTSVTDLKAALSEYIGAVKRGQEVLVTERGKPVAKLVPVPSQGEVPAHHLVELERAGLARLGTGKLPKGFWEWRNTADPGSTVLAALLADREEDR
jgi:prevent-host-death family protein